MKVASLNSEVEHLLEPLVRLVCGRSAAIADLVQRFGDVGTRQRLDRSIAKARLEVSTEYGFYIRGAPQLLLDCMAMDERINIGSKRELVLISACFLFLLPLLRLTCLRINALANQLKKVGSSLPRLFCCPRASMTTNRDSLARMSPPTHSVLQKVGANTRMGDHRSETFERFVPEMVALPLRRKGDCLHRPLRHSSRSHAAVNNGASTPRQSMDKHILQVAVRSPPKHSIIDSLESRGAA